MAEFGKANGKHGGDGGDGGNVSIEFDNNFSYTQVSGQNQFGGFSIQSLGGDGGKGGRAGGDTGDSSAGDGGHGGDGGDIYLRSTGGSLTFNIGSEYVSAIIATSAGGAGGDGGSGGGGGDITIDLSFYDSGLVTTRYQAQGVFAQSLGGTGGSGGDGSGGLGSGSGGGGALAGVGGAVSINLSSGNIETQGDESNAIVAQSIGGFAGDAGDGSGFIAYGADSQSGGGGGAVDVSLGVGFAILTQGDSSAGIIAQSIGGGGGRGGAASGLSSLGGTGSSGGDGGTVNVFTHTSTSITTLGEFSFAIEAQSIGGSGGSAGASKGLVSMGGTAGSGGDGGGVTVDNSATLSTAGDYADALMAQSIGGGGGSGGTAFSGMGTLGEAAVGGGGSGGGNGGDVTVDSSGTIATNLNDSIGIFAQSVGGGGGRAGAVSRSLNGVLGQDLNIGKGLGFSLPAGDGGNGGDVTIELQDGGGITAYGDSAVGIFAQSIGGGGGSAHIVGLEDKAFSFAGGGGDDGNGGDILITLDSAVTAYGEGATAVFAQSNSGTDDTGTLGVNSGDVTVNVNNAVTATGTDGRGLLLQSDGYYDTGQILVLIDVDGSVTTGIDGGDAIGLADGLNNRIANSGTIAKAEDDTSTNYALRTVHGELTMQNYGVFLGSVLLSETDETEIAAATNEFINFEGGQLGLGKEFNLGLASSYLTNDGTMTSGTFGEIGATSFTGMLNQSDIGTYWAEFNFEGEADLITVVSGGSATLAGMVLPNPVETVPEQYESSGVLIFESPTDTSTYDLTVADTATVDYSLYFVHGSSIDQVILGYYVDYFGQDVALTASETGLKSENFYKVADYVSELASRRNEEHASGGSDYAFVQDFILPLLKVSTLEELANVYSHLTASDMHRVSEAHVQSAKQFAGHLMSCPDLSNTAQYAFREEGSCTWGQISLAARSAEQHGNSLAYDEETWRLTTGAQNEIADDWFLGGAFSFERSNIDTSISSISADRFHLGGVLKHEVGQTTYAASLSAGYSENEITRDVLSDFGAVSGSFQTENYWAAAHGRISHLFKSADGHYFEPFADAGIRWINGHNTTFGGALPVDLEVQLSDIVQYSANIGFSMGQEIKTENGIFDIGVDIGVLSMFGNDLTSSAGFAEDPGASIALSSKNEDFKFEVGGHVSAQLGDLTAVKLNVGAEIGEHSKGFAGSLRLSRQF